MPSGSCRPTLFGAARRAQPTADRGGNHCGVAPLDRFIAAEHQVLRSRHGPRGGVRPVARQQCVGRAGVRASLGPALGAGLGVAKGCLGGVPLDAIRGGLRLIPRKHLHRMRSPRPSGWLAGRSSRRGTHWRRIGPVGACLRRWSTRSRPSSWSAWRPTPEPAAGELAVLRLGDLEGRVPKIERNLSLEVLGPTKSSRHRRLTFSTTAGAMT